MKWLKTVIVLLLLVLIPLAVVVGVIASERGCRWVLNHVPGLTITAMHGTLLSQITLTGLRYENPDLSLSADSIHLAWQAQALLTRTLAIDAFTTQKLIITPHPAKPAPPSTFAWQQGIQLPVSIQLKHVQLDDTQLINDGTVLTLKQVNLALQSQNNHVVLQKLSVNLPDIDTKLTGELDLSASFPMQLQGDWRFTHPVGTWQGQLQVTGDINRLTLQHELKQPFAIQSKAEFSEILATPTIKSVSTWQQQLRWPLTGATPQLQSQQGRLEVNGTLNAYQVNASAQLASPNVKQALVSLQGQGSLTNFSFKPLQLTTADGQCQISGEVSWQNFLAFNLALSAKAFNLALLVPDFPSQLTLSSQLRGQYQKDWQASLQIHNIDGTLRGQPITAQGLVEYQHEQLTIKPLTIKIGRNQLKSEGMLSQQQANLTVNADMPDLSVLWPGLAGKINGETTLKGRWPMPDVNAQLSGLDLRLQQYQIKNLALVVDFKPENPNSRIELKADAIHSNALDIAKAHINVSGDINKQQAQSQINTNYGQLSLALSGQWRKPTWSGQVTELSLTATRAGDWHAQVPVLLTAQPLAKALAVELAPLCLSQTAARVCVAGQYIDAQRITASFTSQGLPLALLNPVLPHHAVTFNNSVLNSDVQLKSDASSGWSGQYQFTVPSSTIMLTGAKQPTTLALGELAVKGVLARQQLKTELAFSYEGNNQLTGTVSLGLTAPQALSGQINAKLNSYQLLNAFLPDASITSGLLTANIALAGQLAKPTFTGQLTWHDGTVNSANIGLTDIQIDAIAEQTQHLKLTATAKPFLPTASGLDKTFSLQSELQLSADIAQQKNGLTGEFHFNTGAKTIVQVKQRRQVHTIELTPSTLNAGLDGEQLTGQMTLGLTGNDKGLAQFQLSTASQKLQGHLGLQMSDTAWLDPFLPEVSQLKGRVQADLNVAGQLNAPLLTGQVVVDQAGAKINPLGIVLKDVKLSAVAGGEQSERLQIQGSASSGKGSLQLAGSVLMQPLAGWPTELSLTGKQFEVAKLPEAEINISPDLTFSQAGQQATLNGSLKIPYAKLTIKEVPKSAVVVSQDEVILNQPKPEETKAMKTYGINSTVNVELGDDVSFTGQGLKTQLTGALKIVSAQETLKVHGDVNMSKASYESYGQNLAVRKGRLIFNGPVDNPWLDVEASRLSQDKKVTAVVSVSGPLKAPQTRISSEPALAESDALAYLLTGKPLTQVSQSESNMVASAALAYGSGQMGWVAEQLGIDELSVQQGSTLKDTLLTVGQYLTPDFYVGTKVGLFNKQAVLVLKHKLTDTVNVETQTGTSQRIKLNYEQDKD